MTRRETVLRGRRCCDPRATLRETLMGSRYWCGLRGYTVERDDSRSLIVGVWTRKKRGGCVLFFCLNGIGLVGARGSDRR